MMKRIDWKGLTAQEIATIPNDEFRLQTVERILKERNTNPVKELMLSNDVIREIGDECILNNNGILNWLEFARAILRKASEK